MSSSWTWVVRIGRVAIAAALILGQRANCQSLTPADFENVKTVKDAVQVVKESLKQDGKPELAALLSEAQVREAIRTAIKSYEAVHQEKQEKRKAGSKDHFQNDVKPIFLKIAEDGQWPKGCSFFSFYKLTDRDVTYDGLGLRMQIATPQAKFSGFALPIVDLYYGKFAGFGE
jgi:hypothetical protein